MAFRPSGTRDLVDPAIRHLLDPDPTAEMSPELLALARGMDRVFPHWPDVAGTVSRTVHQAPGPEGAPPVQLIVYRPLDAIGATPCIFHIHGGGYIMGSAEQSGQAYRPLAGTLGCTIVSVDYRLAPEHPFPAGIEDCYAGLAWTFAQAGMLGIDPARIGVMGESAGGGLAASLALLARDRGEYKLAFQHLIYPMIDDRTCTADPHPVAGEFIWTPHNNHFGWSALLGQEPGGEGVSPYAAAARATDLSGLPPAYISTGALDLFLDEDVDYARRLIRAGVPTELHVYPGAIHGFDFFADTHLSEQAWTDAHRWLRKALQAE